MARSFGPFVRSCGIKNSSRCRGTMPPIESETQRGQRNLTLLRDDFFPPFLSPPAFSRGEEGPWILKMPGRLSLSSAKRRSEIGISEGMRRRADGGLKHKKPFCYPRHSWYENRRVPTVKIAVNTGIIESFSAATIGTVGRKIEFTRRGGDTVGTCELLFDGSAARCRHWHGIKSDRTAGERGARDRTKCLQIARNP